jgi:hypothetical protein
MQYRRSGGLAGIDMAAEAQSDDLPTEQAELARQLLSRPPVAVAKTAATGGADQFSYQLRLDDGTRHQSFHWTEHDVPDDVRPLLSTLNHLAHPAPPA